VVAAPPRAAGRQKPGVGFVTPGFVPIGSGFPARKEAANMTARRILSVEQVTAAGELRAPAHTPA